MLAPFRAERDSLGSRQALRPELAAPTGLRLSGNNNPLGWKPASQAATTNQEVRPDVGNPANRLDRVLNQTTFALREVRRRQAIGELSHDLATIWRARLGPMERAFLLAVAVEAAEAEHRDDVAFMLGGPPPLRDPS